MPQPTLTQPANTATVNSPVSFTWDPVAAIADVTGAVAGAGHAAGVVEAPLNVIPDIFGVTEAGLRLNGLVEVPANIATIEGVVAGSPGVDGLIEKVPATIYDIMGTASMGGAVQGIVQDPNLNTAIEIRGITKNRATEFNFRVESSSFLRVRFVLEDLTNVSGFNHVLIIQKSELNPTTRYRVDNPAIFGNTATFVLTPDLLNFTGRRWYEYWIQTGTQQWNKIFKGLIRSESSGIYLPI